MKVLVLTHKPPYPSIDGGCVATSKIIDALEDYKVDYRLAVIHTPKHPFKSDVFPRNIRKKIAAEQFINSTSIWHFIKNIFDWRSSIFIQKFHCKVFQKKLLDFCLSFEPDIIHFESLFMTSYFPALRKKMPQLKFVLRAHNMEHELWEQRAATANFLQRSILKLPVKKLKKWENYILKQMDGVAAIAMNEVIYLNKLSPGVPCIYLPMGVRIDDNVSTYEPTFFHIAAMDWSPNKRALNWFMNKVWSAKQFEGKRLCDKSILHLAGKGLSKYDYKSVSSVKNHGMVTDSREFMCTKGIMLVPLFEGSGLRIKIIEAGALGVPIIATKKAVEGLELVQGEHVLLAETAAEFASAMHLLLDDVSLRISIGQGIKKYMDEHFNEERIKHKLVEFYTSI